MVTSFHPRMVFLSNLGVNRRSRLCDVASYVSAQELDFLDLEQKSSSVNWKHQKVPMPILPIYGWALVNKPCILRAGFKTPNYGQSSDFALRASTGQAASGSNFNPWNTQCMPVVEIFAVLDLGQT